MSHYQQPYKAAGRPPGTAPSTASKTDHMVKALIQRIRERCLVNDGEAGIKNFGRTFRIYDDDRNKSLSFEEFAKGLRDYGMPFTKAECKELFQAFDTDNSGSLNFDEFLLRLRPPMNQARMKLIDQAFRKMDQTGDGVVTHEDLKGVYKCDKHPKYMSGEWTSTQVFKEFLKRFEPQDAADGRVTKEEFINYYAGVSASIDNDAYFDLMMRNSWKL